MQTVKTDQTLQIHRLIRVFVGCTLEGTFCHVEAHTILIVEKVNHGQIQQTN